MVVVSLQKILHIPLKYAQILRFTLNAATNMPPEGNSRGLYNTKAGQMRQDCLEKGLSVFLQK